MSDRSEYCKRLLKKAMIIESNLGPNEKESVSKYLDDLEVKYENNDLLVDEATPCKCEKRSDVIAFNDKNYCCDCLHYIFVPSANKEEETDGKA